MVRLVVTEAHVGGGADLRNWQVATKPIMPGLESSSGILSSRMFRIPTLSFRACSHPFPDAKQRS